MIWLERTSLRQPEIGRLDGCELGQPGPDLIEVEGRDFFVEMFWQGIDLAIVLTLLGPKFDLRQDLIGKRSRHHEGRVSRRIAEIDEPSLRQKDDPLAIRKLDLIDLWLDVVPFEIAQARDLDLGIEMTDVADNGAILHRAHVVDGDDVDVAGAGHE